LTPSTIAWLAGVIDGEGSFASRGQRISCTVVMTDRDVIERIHDVVGGGTVLQLAAPRVGTKTPHLWRLQRRGQIEPFVESIGPLLSARRRARLEGFGLAVGEPRSIVTPEGIRDPEACAWVAGLLEAEGSFYRLERRGGVERRILLEMTDADLVDRYSALTGARRYSVAPRRAAWQATERGTIYRRSDCAAVVEAIRPWLLSRRGQAADALIA
jgi:hypothetical protein